MKLVPLENADFNLVEFKTTNKNNPTPHCKNHGAMNKITSDGIWRCISVTGYEIVKKGNAIGKIHKEKICPAGCKQL